MNSVAQTMSADKRGFVAAYFRRRVWQHLSSLKHGRLLLKDSLGEGVFGELCGPQTTVDVHDLSFYRDLALEGSLGAARAYTKGYWSCGALTELFRLLIRNSTDVDRFDRGIARVAAAVAAWVHRRNANTKSGSRRNIHAHYDLGNDFFALFLDESMTYSAAIFSDPKTSLRTASVAKLDRICRKLALRSEDHVVEIGGGWGSFAEHAALHYGSRVTTTTISRQQFEYARERIARAGLADRVTVLLEDYRELGGCYDKLVSIEMIEAVGHDNLARYFGQCSRLLKADGQMLLQGISMPDQRYALYLKNSDFIQQFVFPGSCCPSISAMLEAVRNSTDLKLSHVEDIGLHYAQTLSHWRQRFTDSEDQVRALGYPAEFFRLWVYYLSYCEAGFAERYLSDYQLHFIKPRCRAMPILGELGM